MDVKSIILELFDMKAVKFGSYTLKSGILSPFYLDLRLSISSPKLLRAIGEKLYQCAKGANYSLLCGVPYTALPFATAISLDHNIPMILRRKERKEYGTGKILEGIFEKGEKCLIVEDLITSGKSILETADPLWQEGLVVKDAVVLVDREQGGRLHLAEKGIALHAVCTITSIVNILLEENKIDEQTSFSTLQFVRNNQL